MFVKIYKHNPTGDHYNHLDHNDKMCKYPALMKFCHFLLETKIELIIQYQSSVLLNCI